MFFIIFPFYSFLYFWLPTVTRESAKLSGKVVPLEFKSDQRLKIWKLHQMKESKFQACCAHHEFRGIFLRFFKVITFLCFTKLSVWTFSSSLTGLKRGKLAIKRRVVGRHKEWPLFLDLIIFYIYYFIDSHKSSSIYFASGEVSSLSVSFLCTTNRRQNWDSELSFILKPMPFYLFSSHLFGKNTKWQPSFCLS